MHMRTPTVKQREILEVALAADVADVKSLLAPLFALDANDIAELRTDAGESAVRYELEKMPGSFSTKLTLYIDPDRTNGIDTDAALAEALVTATHDRAVASLPADHPQAANPAAWMLYAPGAPPKLVHQKARDDDGIDLA